MNRTASKKRELPKGGKKPRTYRRIVTGNVNGRAVVESDEPLLAYEFKTVPAMSTPSCGSTRRFRTSARSRGLIGIPTPSFQDLAVPACTS